MLLAGTIAICDVETGRELVADIFDTGVESISLGLGAVSIGCLLAGTIYLLTSKAQNAFKTITSSTRFGWLLCALFWMLLSTSFAMEFMFGKDGDSLGNAEEARESEKQVQVLDVGKENAQKQLDALPTDGK